MTDAPPPHVATPKDLRNFGLTFAFVSAVFALILLWRGRPSGTWFAGAALIFLAVGLLAPSILRPFFGPWMKFAEILGYLNTRILLGLFFAVGVTPTGLLMRLSGKDPMSRVFKRTGTSTYWTKPAAHPDGARHFIRQF